MRFLIVLALIKCAATNSVIDRSNHKTVSVPIGNGMNVDIDVTVDVNAGGNEQCLGKDRWCYKHEKDCCKGLRCVKKRGSFGEMHYNCRPRKNPQCHANEGEECTSDDECCEEDNICAGYWTNSRELFYEKCKPKPEQCSANKGEECLSDHDCCEKDNVCIVIMKEKRSYCGLKDEGVNDHCTAAGDKCKTDSECCDDQVKLTCKPVAGLKRCMPDFPKCNANEGERCTSDEDCCEKDNTCEAEVAGIRQYCTYNPKDCIEDGEPCHGTDDWVHECCSKSCCEGKCGTCGYTPWFKRF